MAAPQLRRKRSIIYVDGFNLYYGALQHGPYKWLNLERYFRLLRPNDCIQQIRYFTARISGSHAANQETYLLALETLPLLKVVFGRFKSKQLQCLVPSCPLPSPRFFSTYEEKRTDVNIALWMLHDALEDLCDRTRSCQRRLGLSARSLYGKAAPSQQGGYRVHSCPECDS
jgi:hypothetical protein